MNNVIPAFELLLVINHIETAMRLVAPTIKDMEKLEYIELNKARAQLYVSLGRIDVLVTSEDAA